MTPAPGNNLLFGKFLYITLHSIRLLIGMGFCILIMGIPCYSAAASEDTNCNIQQAECRKELGNITVVLGIHPRPVKAMQDLVFRITIEGKPIVGVPHIDLGMPGMKMGPNRVRLKPAGPGVFEGKGIIVRCPSGRTVWRARVVVPDVGTTNFIFNVIY